MSGMDFMMKAAMEKLLSNPAIMEQFGALKTLAENYVSQQNEILRRLDANAAMLQVICQALNIPLEPQKVIEHAREQPAGKPDAAQSEAEGSANSEPQRRLN